MSSKVSAKKPLVSGALWRKPRQSSKLCAQSSDVVMPVNLYVDLRFCFVWPHLAAQNKIPHCICCFFEVQGTSDRSPSWRTAPLDV